MKSKKLGSCSLRNYLQPPVTATYVRSVLRNTIHLLTLLSNTKIRTNSKILGGFGLGLVHLSGNYYPFKR